MKKVKVKIKPFVICRTYSAGVYAGTLESRKGQEAVMTNARMLWRWAGAASLSQMAVGGTSNPNGCKFPVAVQRVDLTQVIAVLYCTAEAEKSIGEVPVWKV